MNFGKPVFRLSQLKRANSTQVEAAAFLVEKKLASHLPDLVVFDEVHGVIPHISQFDAVLLFADVSGFTALTERYTLASDKGTDALTVTLNNYIGKIVEHILRAGGDILKFAGDAILAAWKVKTRADLTFAISQAARCSLIIQEQCDKQDTDVGVQLRVKIAISAGKTYATFVGNDESRQFVMSGRPVREVNAAEKYCQAGLVVLSPNANELLDKENIISSPLSNRFALVKYLRHPEPKKKWETYVDYPLHARIATEGPKPHIRFALNIPIDAHRDKIIRRYVAEVVQKKLADDQPLKYLSEMRQCSILFINLDFDLNENERYFYEKQCSNMQKAFTIIYENCREMHGAVNKVFMFDKGCTFLIIFGLPGNKHEQEPAHALQASWKISQELHRDLSSVILASFGVTTGAVFCGVIGHEERHEYTVIGQKVNLAARLMIYYPNMISCDYETYHDSKLSLDLFTKQIPKQLKGIGSVIVYRYSEGIRKIVTASHLPHPEYPILGRIAEIELVKDELKNIKSNKGSDAERVVIFEGEAGYGKTRLMQEISSCSSNEGFQVISYSLSINDLGTPFFALKALLNILMCSHFETSYRTKSKERILLDTLGSADILCLLNEILEVTFPLTSEVLEMKNKEKMEVTHNIIGSLVRKLTKDRFTLFLLDDAHNVDNESWEFLPTLCRNPQSLMVLAMRPFALGRSPPNCAKELMYQHNTVCVKLKSLLIEDLAPMACQMLRVMKIPAALHTALIQKSHGVPLWCEQILREMQNAGVIKNQPYTVTRGASASASYKKENPVYSGISPKTARAEKTKPSLVSRLLCGWAPASKVAKIEPNSKNDASWMIGKERKGRLAPVQCVVKDNFDLTKFPVPASIRGVALARLDKLQPFERILVKSAAVIGNCTSRKMLKAVVPGFGEEKFRRAIHQLMLTHVFECASQKTGASERMDLTKKQTVQITGRSYGVICRCTLTNTPSTETSGTPRTRCEQFRFQSSLVQETAYKLWLQDQRKSLHESCACYLESKVNEILQYGQGDPDIIKQFQLLRSLIAYEHTSRSRESIAKSGHEFGALPNSPIPTNVSRLQEHRPSNISAPGRISTETQGPLDKSASVAHAALFQNVPESVRRRFSLLSAPASIAEDTLPHLMSIATPLELREVKPPLRQSAAASFQEQSQSKLAKAGEKRSETERSWASGDAWAKVLNIPPIYEKVINNSEEQARQLPLKTQVVAHQSPHEIHDNLSLLYQQLVHHWRNAVHTENTLVYLIKTAESKIAIMKLSVAVFYLQIAEEIVDHLDKGRDVVAKVERAGSYGQEIEILQVDRVMKARIHKLLGKAFFRQEEYEKSLTHFTKALKILRCSLPNNYLCIKLWTANEIYKQKLHLKKPEKHIGSVSHSTGYRYIEQVQCLAYIWQLLKKMKRLRYRKKLSHLVALMQVNRAEASDFNFQELISSYISMMQQSRIKRNLLKSAIYESKAIMRCSDLPWRVTASDLFVIANVHLACCSFRLCHGRLELAITAAYRTYNVANFLSDNDLKLIVLPLMAQLHFLTGRGRSCIETLMLLRQIAKSNSDVGLFPYYMTCFDMILDGGYSLENIQSCIDYMENLENFCIGYTLHKSQQLSLLHGFHGAPWWIPTSSKLNWEGARNSTGKHRKYHDPQFFCAKATLAVWYFRQNNMKGHIYLKLATEARSINFDNYFVIHGFARYVEAYLLLLYSIRVKKVFLNGSDKIAVRRTSSKLLKKLNEFSKSYPVIYARYLHFVAYRDALFTKHNTATKLLDKSIQFADSCSNFIDHQWASHSKIIWFCQDRSQAKTSSWISNCNNLPNWEKAKNSNPIERSFAFKVKTS